MCGYFEGDFEILMMKETVYYGSVEPRPRALFFVMRRKDEGSRDK